ncbi:MAG: translation elongation factor Ts [Verrucomicrobia bacterium]|nr:translation elongation factor Ts [Verrucomicrobiota bacterium]
MTPEFTAADVGKLRMMTNAGLMDCKKALTEAKGDVNLAIEILRKKGVASAEKKALRAAKEGVIVQAIAPGARAGILVEVNCETDFVARNESFRAFCDEIARKLLVNPAADVEADRIAAVAKIGENILVTRQNRMEVTGHGMIAAYIHTGAKVGVLVEVNATRDDTVARDEFKQAVRDVTLQIAAASPITVSRDQVDPAVLDKEKEIAAAQFKDKPPQALARIVEGKLEKFFQSFCLLEQGFVKQNSEVSVRDYIASVAKPLNDTITVRRFVRFQVGEIPA